MKKIIERTGPEQGSLLDLLTEDIRPTNLAIVLEWLDGQAKPRIMAWGFPKWDGQGVVFNARSETALDKTMFKQALLERPIVVPVTGFYEWKAVPGKKNKDKYIFTLGDDELLYLAGIYSVFKDQAQPERFTILTTFANESMNNYHDRMPVILGEAKIDQWLAGVDRQSFFNRQQCQVFARLVAA